MAIEKEKSEERTLEMRLAAIEDKLQQMDISEEDMRTYQRVAQRLGAGGSVAAGCIVDCIGGCVNECGIRARFRGTPITRYRQRFVCECNECSPPCWSSGGAGGGWGGGFENLGG